MKAKIIGCGAAGNKAVIYLIEQGVVNVNNVLLINSTVRDTPESYSDSIIKLGDNTRSGCGKEPALAEELTYEAIGNGSLSVLDTIIDPGDESVIIITSSEGGSGCGMSPVIARYFKEVFNINVHMVVFTGFEEDARGLENTVNYFDKMDEDYTIEIISNKKFLAEAKGNKLKAEKLANDELRARLQVLFGHVIIESEQNIDETDLYKVVTTAGYITIETAVLDKIKNVDQFNSIIQTMLDNTKSLDLEDPGCKRLAVILNISDKTRDYIDYNFEVLKERFGIPYEIFQHIQFTGDTEFISVIISGMRMPVDEIAEVLAKYNEIIEKVNRTNDDFFAKNLNVSNGGIFDSAKGRSMPNDINDKKKMFLKQKSNNTKDIKDNY